MKTFIAATSTMLFVTLAMPRPVRVWTYEELLEQADVAAIIQVTKIEKTEAQLEGHGDPKQFRGKRATATVGLKLKGVADQTIQFDFFTYSSPTAIPPNGAMFPDLSKADKSHYLVFLKKTTDGMHIPVSGHYDGSTSIRTIESTGLIRIETTLVIAQPTATATGDQIAVFVNRLKDKNASTEELISSIEALGNYGPLARKSVPDLAEVLAYRFHHKVRKSAFTAIEKIDPEFRRTVPLLIEKMKKYQEQPLDKPKEDLHYLHYLHYTSETLEWIGPQAEASVPILTATLKVNLPFYPIDGNLDAPYAAARALGTIGNSGIPPLIEALQDDEDRIRQIAASGLGRGGPQAEKSVPTLVKALNDKNLAVRKRVATALGKVGSDNPEVAPALTQLLLQKDLRVTALMALIDIGSKAEKAKPVLITLLDDEEMNVRFKAAHALWRIENGDEYDVAKLIETLERGDTPFRMFAADALANLGPKAKESLSALIQALNDEDVWVRRFSAQAFGMIGAKDQRVVTALIRILKDPEPRVRRFAVYSLGELGPITPDVEPAIRSMLNDQDAIVRSQATKALKQISHNGVEDTQ